MRIDQRFVLLPINNQSQPRRVRLVKDGRVLRSFTASLGLPAQWWAHLDARAWESQTLTLSVGPDTAPPASYTPPGRGAGETANEELAAAIHTGSEIWSPETLYAEPERPTFHFTPSRGWTNDPNGLVYHAGQYHLFFQHNPYGVRGGNQHWGHAVSTDLVHWKELPTALYPRGDDDYPFSGSGVVDHENSSGWAKDGRPPLVIAFTSTARGTCIAYSNDNGTTWTEFDENPVLRHGPDDARDAKLLWHAPTRQWVLAVFSVRPGAEPPAPKRHGIAFHTSADLKTWCESSWIEGYYECPDLFALPVDDDPKCIKWVLSCAVGYYHIGQFDGSRFIIESPRLPAPGGGASNSKSWQGVPLVYAAQTFGDHPEGHCVQMAWGRVDTANEPFTQLLTFPTRLSLRTTSEGVLLCREPVDAIKSLRVRTHDFPAGPLTSTPILAQLEGEAWDIEAVIKLGTMSPILMNIGGDEYTYSPGSQMLDGPKGAMRIPLADGRLRLRILVDRTTVEIFGDRGQAYGMFVRTNPSRNAPLQLRTWKLLSDGLCIEQLSAHALRPIWST